MEGALKSLRRILAVLVILGAISPNHATNALEGRELRFQIPVFRARTDLVQLDVTVLDSTGRPVPGLVARDFRLVDNGQPAVVEVVSEVRIPRPIQSADWMREVSGDLSTNRPVTEKRLVLIVVDDGRLSAFASQADTVRRILRDLVAQVGPDDLAALVFTAVNKGAQEFTHDRALLLAAIDTMQNGWGSSRYPPVFEAYSVDVISRAARQLINIRSRRKLLIYVGNAQAVAINPAGGSRRLGGPDNFGIAGRVDAVLRDAQKAGVSIFAVAPGQLPRPRSGAAQYHRDLSRFTGGFAVSGAAPDASVQIARIFEETGHYYTLGFRPADKVGTWFRKIEVGVNKPDVTVRAQAGYYPPRALQDEPSSKPSSPGIDRDPATSVLSGILPAGEIPLELALTPFGAPTSTGSNEGSYVAVNVGIDSTAIRLAGRERNDALDLHVRVFDGEGVREIFRERVGIPVGTVDDRQMMIALKPGRYNFRVAVYDRASGLKGSVYGTTTVPDVRAEELAASGVFVVGTPTSLPGTSGSVIQAPATSIRRRFGMNESFELGARVSAGKGLRTQIGARIQIIDATGRVVWSSTRHNLTPALNAVGWADVFVPVAARQLRPGSHLIRFVFTAGDTEVVRNLAFWIVE